MTANEEFEAEKILDQVLYKGLEIRRSDFIKG